MTDHTATPEQWDDTEHWARQHGHAQACIFELRTRIEVEAAEPQASKVYQVSKPLKLTAKQQAELQALLTPDFRVGMTLTSTSNQVDSSLVDQVARRPKHPNLKEQALAILSQGNRIPTAEEQDTIRRALEQLDD